MKRTKQTIEQVRQEYTSLTGKTPTQREIEALYHEYMKNWEKYNGLSDWMIYCECLGI